MTPPKLPQERFYSRRRQLHDLLVARGLDGITRDELLRVLYGRPPYARSSWTNLCNYMQRMRKDGFVITCKMEGRAGRRYALTALPPAPPPPSAPYAERRGYIHPYTGSGRAP